MIADELEGVGRAHTGTSEQYSSRFPERDPTWSPLHSLC